MKGHSLKRSQWSKAIRTGYRNGRLMLSLSPLGRADTARQSRRQFCQFRVSPVQSKSCTLCYNAIYRVKVATGYRLLDFYFADTDELLKCAWISDMCTVHEFIDCARALGYLRHDCRLSEVAVVHRAKVLGNDVLLSSVDVAPGERLLVLRSGRDVDSECVFALMSQGLSVPRAMALLRYTSNDLGEARGFVGSVWDPRSVRDMLLDEGRSLFKIVKLIGCQNRQFAEHFLGSLLLNPACFERELASIAFDCCAKSEYDGGPLFHTFSLLLRTYHHVMPNATRDCRLCKGCMFSEHEMRRAENHHMTGKSVLQSLKFGQLEEVRHAAREFRKAVDAGFCPSLVLYSWCLEIFCDGRDDYEIRLCLNSVDHATCGLSDKYVQRLYRKLRKRHGKDTSRRLGSARNMREYHQKACIVRSWGLEHLKVKAILNKPVEIHEYLRSAANSGDSWARNIYASPGPGFLHISQVMGMNHMALTIVFPMS